MKVRTNARGKVVFVNRYYQPDESATSQLLSGLARALAGCGLSVEIVCSRQLYNDPRQSLPAHEVLERRTEVRQHIANHRAQFHRWYLVRFPEH